ncbi:MAG: BrnT family toxin [Fibrobacter sp.]|nr:BrnT family toxin [Fibrobacter sp.]MCQ2122480.1 BrnT family toxin [Fibrobacter sp.]
MEIDFEWDEKKNEINQKKHGVSFEEAKSCFEDEHARVFFDVEHSKDEDRSILIGLSSELRILIVVYTERINGNDDLIVNRIISARKATKKEFQYYWNARKGDEP